MILHGLKQSDRTLVHRRMENVWHAKFDFSHIKDGFGSAKEGIYQRIWGKQLPRKLGMFSR